MAYIDPDQPAQNPFWFSECFLMPMPLGKKASNLRELFDILQEADESVLHYHLLQFRLAVTQPWVEYPNEFALWAATALQDPRLAEKLSSFDPFDYDTMGQVRQAILDILEEYLWHLPLVPWARPGAEFHFCESSMVVIRQEMPAATLREFCTVLRKVGLDSVYYHFFEARHRLEMRQIDDFSYWIDTNFDLPDLVAALRDLDIYFFSLSEIRDILLRLIQQHLGELCESL
ncbi:MAG: DUF5752 family protein [Desulfobaccales bacterium]